MAIRAVLFDLDQTLVDRDATFRHFAEDQWLRFRDDMRSISPEQYVICLVSYDNNGYNSKDFTYDQTCKNLGIAIPPRVLIADYHLHYGMKPVLADGAKETLLAMQETYRLGLITNGRSKSQRAKIESANLKRFFRVVAISEEVGFKKPAPPIFRFCIDALDCRAEEIVCVGDNPEADIQGANNNGLKSIWVRTPYFDPPSQCDGIVDSVRELPEAISKIEFASRQPEEQEKPQRKYRTIPQ